MKRIKKLLLTLCLAFMMLSLTPSVAPQATIVTTVQAATKVSISKKTLKLYAGKSKTIKLKGLTKAQTKKIKWTSNKKRVATVKNGKIKAKKAGTAVITAKYNGKKYKCKVTVKKTAGSSSGGSSSGGSSSGESSSGGTVYWTPSGSVYHLSRYCSTLSRSKTVNSGSISQSGKPRACKVCG